MTAQPPTPRVGGFTPPVGRPAGAASPASAPKASGSGGVSPLSVAASDFVKPRLLAPRERILLAGDSNSGKSYAYYRMALNAYLDAHNWPGNTVGTGAYTGPKFYIVDTDDTTPTYLSEDREFAFLYYENGGNMYPFPAFNWQETRKAIASIIHLARRGDWIIIDLMSRVYDHARDYVADLKNFNRSDEAIKRSLEQKGFGEGEQTFWSVASLTHDSVSNALLLSDSVQANILALAHTTDMIDSRERREIIVMFDDIGIKPRGRPQIPGQMNTVVVIWSRKVIEREGTKRKTNGKEYVERFFDIVKDRGEPFSLRVPYDQDFYEQLKQVRKEKQMRMVPNLPPELHDAVIDVRGTAPAAEDAPALDEDVPAEPVEA